MEVISDEKPILGPLPLIAPTVVGSAINIMKHTKDAGCSGLVADMIKASGDIGVRLVTELINSIIREERIPDEWHKSVIVNILYILGKGGFAK